MTRFIGKLLIDLKKRTSIWWKPLPNSKIQVFHLKICVFLLGTFILSSVRRALIFVGTFCMKVLSYELHKKITVTSNWVSRKTTLFSELMVYKIVLLVETFQTPINKIACFRTQYSKVFTFSIILLYLAQFSWYRKNFRKAMFVQFIFQEKQTKFN